MEVLSVKEIAQAVNGRILCGNENTLITSVGTNSKQMEPDSLFVPVVGERVDAHDFIEDAFLNGAVACFTSRKTALNTDKAFIQVDDTLKALQALGAYYRKKFQIPVIGITGSVGKTTTKEMIAAALATKYNVLKTEGNMNSQIGLPLMMLRITSDHEIAVIEMGMSKEGEMERLVNIAMPEVAVMTNIGVSHIAQLKTRENIRKEKLNIINAFHKDSVLFINGNDDLLGKLYKTGGEIPKDLDVSEKTLVKYKEAKVIAYGEAAICDYRAENIRTENGKTYFTLKKKNGDTEEIVLQVLGIHNVYNALAALAVAEYYHIPVNMAKKGLYDYEPMAMRGQIKKAGQITIIDDSYNASPDSMKSGIQVLLELENVKRRIAVLADVLELGEISDQCHYDVGAYIAGKNIDEVITVGQEAKFIVSGIKDNDKTIITHSFLKNEDAIAYLKTVLKPGDGILIKGSRGMKTDEIVKAISQ